MLGLRKPLRERYGLEDGDWNTIGIHRASGIGDDMLQGGPKTPVTSGVITSYNITPIRRVITPVTHL